MKLFAPEYYKDFLCIADKCRHSCCIGWEIDIDSDTMEKYALVSDEYGEEIRKSIEMEDVPHFRLSEMERCPHLDSRGLCRIITRLGEGYLCDICREHPRFYNETARGLEVGLGMACEEAARLILSSDRYGKVIHIGEVDEKGVDLTADGVRVREDIYSVLCDRSKGYDRRLRAISSRYAVTPFSKSAEQWKEVLQGLEYLAPSHRELFLRYKEVRETPRELECVLERALAYFVYRHVSAADEGDISASVGFSLFCERLLCSLAMETDPEEMTVADIARIISEELEYSEDNTEALKLEVVF